MGVPVRGKMKYKHAKGTRKHFDEIMEKVSKDDARRRNLWKILEKEEWTEETRPEDFIRCQVTRNLSKRLCNRT